MTLVDISIDAEGRFLANGQMVTSFARPFGTRIDLRVSKRPAAFYHRSVSDTMRAPKCQYPVQVAPKYVYNLVTSDWGGYHGFGMYRTNESLTLQFRALAVQQLLHAPSPEMM